MQFLPRIPVEFVRSFWMKLMLILIVILPFAIGLSLVYKSIPFLHPDVLYNVLFSSEWIPMQGKFGLWPFIWSSILISIIGLILMIPLCLAASIFITQFAPIWIARLLRTVIDI